MSGTENQNLLIRAFERAVEDELMPVIRSKPVPGGDPAVLAAGEGELVFKGSVAPEQSWSLGLLLPEAVRVVAHGHSAALWLGESQIAEIHVVSSNPASVSHSAMRPQQHIKLQGRGGTLRISLRTEGFLLMDRGVGREGLGWKRHTGRRSLNYLLDRRGSEPPSKLLVVFSAIGGNFDFTFNYRATLGDSPLPKAYVLDDFGSQGSYYWMDHGDDSIFIETQALLKGIVDELGLDLQDVMFAGSSKGGTAALLHGVTMGVGRVLLGAPQYRVGDYLANAAPQILEFIAGGKTDYDRLLLNEKAKAVLQNGHRGTAIRVAVGTADHHLATHVQPLLTEAVDAGYRAEGLVLPGVPHSEIGWVFKHLLAAEAWNSANGIEQQTLPYSLTRKNDEVKLRCWLPEGETLAVHLSGKSAVLERRSYSTDTEFTFVIPEGERAARARIFRRKDSDSTIQAFTTRWI